MLSRFKKTPAAPAPVIEAPEEPTLEIRLARATNAANSHLTAFRQAADGLDKAAEDLDILSAEYAAVETLAADNKVHAEVAAIQHRNQAQSIRNLIGVK